jgi:prepilin-type N-terminal cleavage/methylation domain-containing protein/prepilin-type processing-associated H-X9-DG protein
MKTNRRYAGFTLIELMVVVAVIGILITILFPVVSRVQERAREVHCTNNLKQLHIATVNYMHANRGRLPYSANGLRYHKDWDAEEIVETEINNAWVMSVNAAGEVSADGHAWWYERGYGAGNTFGTHSVTNGRLFRYVGDTGDEKVYICPTMARIAQRELTLDRRYVVRSYGMNNRLNGRNYNDVMGPSRTMLFADQGFRAITNAGRRWLTGSDNGWDDDPPPEYSATYWNSSEYYYMRKNRGVDGSIDSGPQTDPNRSEWIGEYHGPKASVLNQGRANVVFLDGHVEQIEYRHTDKIAIGNWEDGQPL